MQCISSSQEELDPNTACSFDGDEQESNLQRTRNSLAWIPVRFTIFPSCYQTRRAAAAKRDARPIVYCPY